LNTTTTNKRVKNEKKKYQKIKEKTKTYKEKLK